jgi:ubiquinone/menaquinone biosynthesis C-methylase UbiE
MEDYDVVKSDFNKIAGLGAEPKWNHNNCYFGALLQNVPENAGTCLDIGCGKGDLSRLLSRKASRVIAVDLADQMISYAKANNAADNIEYICGNVLNMDFGDNSLDIIITTATAHHLPYEWLLEFAKTKLKKSGKLIILDLVKAATFSDWLIWGFAVLPNVIMNIAKNGRLQKEDPHTAQIWNEHGGHDTLMTMPEIRKIAAKTMPDAVIRRKLFWRYTLIWKKT